MLVSNKPVVEHRSRVKGRLFFLCLGEEKIYIYIQIHKFKEWKRTHPFSVTLSFARKRSSEFCLTSA